MTPRIPKEATNWHPLLGAEVRIWYQGAIETRVCTEVSPNDLWGRFDGELLPIECVISEFEYQQILTAIDEVRGGSYR